MHKIRAGFGYDIHKIKSGKGLYIGGISISDEYEFIAHSDGDILIHSLIDSLTGASGESDIGELFPNTNNEFKNIKSIELLKRTLNILESKKFEILNIDCVIIAENFKIAPFKNEIRKKMSSILGIGFEDFNIKGKTKEGVNDPVGRGEAIECYCSSMIRYIE